MSFPNIVFVASTRRVLGQFALNCQFIVQLKIVLRVQVPTSIYISNVSFGQCLGKTRLLASDNTLDPGTQAGEHACELVWSSLEDSPFISLFFSLLGLPCFKKTLGFFFGRAFLAFLSLSEIT